MQKETNTSIKTCGKCLNVVQSKNWRQHWRRKDHKDIVPYTANHAHDTVPVHDTVPAENPAQNSEAPATTAIDLPMKRNQPDQVYKRYVCPTCFQQSYGKHGSFSRTDTLTSRHVKEKHIHEPEIIYSFEVRFYADKGLTQLISTSNLISKSMIEEHDEAPKFHYHLNEVCRDLKDRISDDIYSLQSKSDAIAEQIHN